MGKRKRKCIGAGIVMGTLISEDRDHELMLLQQYEHRAERAMQSCVRQLMALKKFEAAHEPASDDLEGAEVNAVDLIEEVDVIEEVEHSVHEVSAATAHVDRAKEANSPVSIESSEPSASCDTRRIDSAPTLEANSSPFSPRTCSRGERAMT